MGIPAFHSILFFFLVLIIGLGLFPSDRELGMRYALSRANERAVQYLTRHFDKNPLDYANTLRYVESLAEAGSSQEAIDILEKLTAQQANQPQIFRILSKLHLNHLNEAKASIYLENLLDLNIPKSERVEIIDKLKAYYSVANEKQKSKILYHKEWLHSKDLAWLYEAAHVTSRMGDYSETHRFYEIILGTNAFDIEALTWLAEYNETIGERTIAFNYYEKISQRVEADDYWKLKYVSLLFESGKFSTLIPYLENAEPLFKEQKSRLMYLADALLAIGNLEKSIQTWEIIVEQYPKDSVVLEGYVYALMEAKQFNQIINKLEQWHEKKEGSYRTHHLLGDAYSAVGRSDDASREYQGALQLIRS